MALAESGAAPPMPGRDPHLRDGAAGAIAEMAELAALPSLPPNACCPIYHFEQARLETIQPPDPTRHGHKPK